MRVASLHEVDLFITLASVDQSSFLFPGLASNLHLLTGLKVTNLTTYDNHNQNMLSICNLTTALLYPTDEANYHLRF